jgi:hypothetical protein
MAKSRPDKSPRLKGWLWKSALVLFLVVLFLGGVIWAGRWGREQLPKERYEVTFADIECDAPACMTKAEFLNEVLYASRLRKRLSVVDISLPQQLRDGFAKHPWVEQVNEVKIEPPRQIIVKLAFRKPVLAVKLDSAVRAVDGFGVLLPRNAPTDGLPIYDGLAKAPQGDGKRWGDPNVEAAARKWKK